MEPHKQPQRDSDGAKNRERYGYSNHNICQSVSHLERAFGTRQVNQILAAEISRVHAGGRNPEPWVTIQNIKTVAGYTRWEETLDSVSEPASRSGASGVFFFFLSFFC